jgi:hypothetical protein
MMNMFILLCVITPTQVIGEMKLESVANSLIGDPQQEGSMSRNERKRLNFATETLTEPALLLGERLFNSCAIMSHRSFLHSPFFSVDEPTTGLDSTMAASVVKQLKVNF